MLMGVRQAVPLDLRLSNSAAGAALDADHGDMEACERYLIGRSRSRPRRGQPMTTRSAAVYVRISQDRGGAGLGVQRQEKECRALAERLGWTVTEVYCDDDISAFSGKPSSRLRADAGRHRVRRITAVIAWHPDRLHRRSAELERYISVCERHGVANQTVTAGMWDLSTPSGRMTPASWVRWPPTSPSTSPSGCARPASSRPPPVGTTAGSAPTATPKTA